VLFAVLPGVCCLTINPCPFDHRRHRHVRVAPPPWLGWLGSRSELECSRTPVSFRPRRSTSVSCKECVYPLDAAGDEGLARRTRPRALRLCRAPGGVVRFCCACGRARRGIECAIVFVSTRSPSGSGRGEVGVVRNTNDRPPSARHRLSRRSNCFPVLAPPGVSARRRHSVRFLRRGFAWRRQILSNALLPFLFGGNGDFGWRPMPAHTTFQR